VNPEDFYERVLGCLAGACIGDAMGAPTEQRTAAEISEIWGGPVETFVAPPADSPFSKGRRAGQLTDDSSQLIALMDVYLNNDGAITAGTVAEMLLAWSETEYFPRFAGPTTKRAIVALRDGADPEQLGAAGQLSSDGTSNGAAMRVAPVGLRYPGQPDAAIRDALTSCRPSHFTSIGVAGAAAMAAAVSVAVIPGASLLEVVGAARRGAEEGARLGRQYGRDAPGPSVSCRIDIGVAAAMRCGCFSDAVQAVAQTVGTGLHMAEAVPAAIAIFLAAEGDPFLACVGGANGGDDTDTVACIAGALAGAYRGFRAIPPDLYATVLEENQLDLETRARAFAELIERKRLDDRPR